MTSKFRAPKIWKAAIKKLMNKKSNNKKLKKNSVIL